MDASSSPDPAHIQRNIESLLKIGGVYDFIAMEVERRHADLLVQYRLDTGAKPLVDLLQERGHLAPTHNTHTPKEQ